MSQQGQQVFGGRYELHRKVARGGMADVYLARDTSLDRPVALKVLFPEFATDPSFVQRFRREAQAAANLGHPGIVPVYDWGEEGGTYFIVMEYVEGRSLAEIIRSDGPLHPDRAADIAADIAAALGFAHAKGVVHRDVKPANVLINQQGMVKVADFGIARAVSTTENLTQTGTVMGTATYFSPEQAQGRGVDARSDVYSLGVVLYEMLTGGPPFTADSPVSLAYKHVQEVPDPPSRRNPDVPPALEAVTLKALAKNPANRYATAEDLRADLRRFRAGREVAAEPVMVPPTAVDQPTRAQEATRVAAAYGGATAAQTPVDGRGYAPGYDRYEEAPRRRGWGFAALLIVLLALLAGAVWFAAQTLSTDAEQVVVPGVVNLAEEEAVAQLEAAGLDEWRVEPEEHPEVPEGVVFRQNPIEGASVDDGTEVVLGVSSGQPPVEVPNLVGEDAAAASATLEELGLVPEVRPEENDAPEGEVLRQSPPAGSEARRGDTVRLIVSSGATDVTVPALVGLSQSDAVNELSEAGLGVRVLEEQSDEPRGTVVRSDPQGGATVEEGTRVTIVVSTGQPTTTTSTTTTSSTTTTTTRGGGGGGGGNSGGGNSGGGGGNSGGGGGDGD